MQNFSSGPVQSISLKIQNVSFSYREQLNITINSSISKKKRQKITLNIINYIYKTNKAKAVFFFVHFDCSRSHLPHCINVLHCPPHCCSYTQSHSRTEAHIETHPQTAMMTTSVWGYPFFPACALKVRTLNVLVRRWGTFFQRWEMLG